MTIDSKYAEQGGAAEPPQARQPWRERLYDYIVVGSGAGGGTVASNLARAGYTVALLEAGGADTPASYDTPAFFAKASEDVAMRWDYIVHHYDDPKQERRDPKAVELRDEFGVWYPRSGTLGGCTAHNALITIVPHDSDWEHIADLTGDDSWRAKEMRQYFRRIERCEYITDHYFGRPHPGNHGFLGWLTTGIARPKLLVADWKVFRIVVATLLTTIQGKVGSSLRYFWGCWKNFTGGPIEFITSFFDPNDMRLSCFERAGLFFVPFAIQRGQRMSVRDLINVTAQDFPDKLDIYTNCLVTRVLFDEVGSAEGPRATGVEFMEGLHLYQADPRCDPTDPTPPRQTLRARREVILCGGAFNSPQLLMLSGIGPGAHLREHDIEPVVDRPGVGRNLQDRYEVGVVTETKTDFALTKHCTFKVPNVGEYADPQYSAWLKGQGPYTTNGVLVCITLRSTPERKEADVFMFCVPGVFKGYFPGWTKDIATQKSQFSWLILKSHTNNRAGAVTLRSKDPTQTPRVSFRYFEEGSPGFEADRDAVVAGIEYVRRVTAKVSGFVSKELVPGAEYDDRDKLRQFVTDNAWGHHCSCTNAMGRPDDPMAVVDSNFRVIGTRGLRVVDASIFPRIPGFFIVTPIYMIAEKASDAIVADARRTPASVAVNPPS
jgi:choline dehydrogenase